MDVDEEPIPLVNEEREIIGDTQVDPEVSEDVNEHPIGDVTESENEQPLEDVDEEQGGKDDDFTGNDEEEEEDEGSKDEDDESYTVDEDIECSSCIPLAQFHGTVNPTSYVDCKRINSEVCLDDTRPQAGTLHLS